MVVGLVETVMAVGVLGGVEVVGGVAIYHLTWTLFLMMTYNSILVVLETVY